MISCATAQRPYATVEVANLNGRTATFSALVDHTSAEGDFGRLDHCEVDPEADVKGLTTAPGGLAYGSQPWSAVTGPGYADGPPRVSGDCRRDLPPGRPARQDQGP